MALQIAAATTNSIGHGDVAFLDGDVAWTWLAWFRRVGAGDMVNDAFQTLYKGANAYMYHSSNTTPNGIAVYDGSGAETRSSTANLLATTWTYVAITSTGGGATPAIYVNGAAAAMTGGAQVMTDTAAAILKWQGNASTAIEIAHFKLYSVAFNVQSVQKEMFSYVPVEIAGLQIWSPYDDATSARDYSGQGNHGTIVNTVTQVAGPGEVSYGTRAILARNARGGYGRRNQFRRLGPSVPYLMNGV